MRRLVRTVILVVGAIVLLAQCANRDDGGNGSPSTSTEADGGDGDQTELAGPSDRPEPEPEPPPCDATPELALDVPAGPLTAAELASDSFDCVEQVVLVAADAPSLAAVAAPLAVSLQAPLLIGDEADLGDTIATLGDPEVRQLVAAEPEPADDPSAGETEIAPDAAASASASEDTDAPPEGTDPPPEDTDPPPEGTDPPPAVPTAAALEIADELGTARFVAAAADRPDHLAAAAHLAVASDAAVLPVDPSGDAPQLPADAEVTTIGDLTALLPDATAAEGAWEADADARWAFLVDPAAADAAQVSALAALRGDTVIAAPGGDLLDRRTVDRVRSAGFATDQLVPVGDLGGDLDRDLRLLAEGPLLPGGTLRHFDGTRMVALYGVPGTAALGVLGEQDLDATIERAREVGAGYDADGRDVIPTLEVIVTVASAEAGDDGNYSRVAPPERFRELVDRAGEEGMQVILDLQPGRNDFLDQARIYEDLLREPHVGLALDPEWRLLPDQVHLRQIGRVEAAEVQRVVDWYAELTRNEGLPQQLLILHQFRLSMLQDRDTIDIPPEIAAVVHADGQGSQPAKLATWRALTAGAEDRWFWGWKNFYDEDPVVAEPSYILDLDPEVVLVTYQ